MSLGGAPPAGGHHLSRWLFLRLLGAVYLIAFASLAGQITGLVGEHGLLPAGSFLDWAHSIYGRDAYRLLPTVFWLDAGDLALQLAVWAGAALSLLVIAGVAPRAVLAILWVLYLSLTVAGQDFLSFQWDALLLETGLHATLVTTTPRARWSSASQSDSTFPTTPIIGPSSAATTSTSRPS